MSAPERDREREIEAGLARLATRAVPDDAPVPAPPWQQRRATVTDVRRYGRATPWLVAAVLLVLAGLGIGAGVAFDASGPDRGPVATEPPSPTATATSSDGTLGDPTTAATPSSRPSLDRGENSAAPDEGQSTAAAGTRVVGVGRYGPVTVGMTQAQAVAALGLTDAAVADGPNSCFRYLPLTGNRVVTATSGLDDLVVVDTATGRVVMINPPSSARTSSGIGTGSTLAAVRAAYPGGTLADSFGGSIYTVLGSGDLGTGFVFGSTAPSDSDTVAGVVVGTRDYAQGAELYCTNPN